MRYQWQLITMVIMVFSVFSEEPGTTTHRTDTVKISEIRRGRKIMHDGFLMDWLNTTSHVLGGDSVCVWDAVATTEGLAGYIRSSHILKCSKWSVMISTSSPQKRSVFRFPEDTAMKNVLFKTDCNDSTGMWTIEWLVPWPDNPEIKTQSIMIIAQNECSLPQVPVVVIDAERPADSNREKRGLIGKGIVIVVLAGMYLMVQKRIRNQSR